MKNLTRPQKINMAKRMIVAGANMQRLGRHIVGCPKCLDSDAIEDLCKIGKPLVAKIEADLDETTL